VGLQVGLGGGGKLILVRKHVHLLGDMTNELADERDDQNNRRSSAAFDQNQSTIMICAPQQFLFYALLW
jgi:hypothetical protein